MLRDALPVLPTYVGRDGAIRGPAGNDGRCGFVSRDDIADAAVAVRLAQAYASRAQYVAPEWMVEGCVSTYVAVQAGELDVITRDVERFDGAAGDECRGVPQREPRHRAPATADVLTGRWLPHGGAGLRRRQPPRRPNRAR